MNINDTHVSSDEAIRVVTVINKKLEPGRAMNTIAHLAMGLVNVMGEEGRLSLKFLNFSDLDSHIHPSISARSLIVLRGTSNEIRMLRKTAFDQSIPYVDFTDTMVGETYVEQLQRTAATSEMDLSYDGIALLGSREQLQPLTRKFSLWK